MKINKPTLIEIRIILFAAVLFAASSVMIPVPITAAEGPPPYPAPPLDPGALTGDEMAVMELGLESILVDFDDLGFKKDYVDDPYRLDVVQAALDDPLSLVEWNYGWDAFLLEEKPASEILQKAGEDLDCVQQDEISLTTTETSAGITDSSGGIPEIWINTLNTLDIAVYQATERMTDDVLSSLTEDDIDFLRYYLLCHFADEEWEECPESEVYGSIPEFMDPMLNFDISSLIATTAALKDSVDMVISEMLENTDGIKRDGPFGLDGLTGKIHVGSVHDDIWYPGDLEPGQIIIDPGGNDIYSGAVGMAGTLGEIENPPVCVVIDLGGDDTYLSYGERSNGSGVMGIAIQVDCEGDDTYKSGKFSQGCGVFGAGILEDRGDGKDIYDADLLVQGAGAIGVGLLMDSGGNDNYHAGFYAQGFGYVRGWGMLTDRDGYDSYYAGGEYDAWPTWGGWILSCSQGYSFGIRPVASGGVGIIHDRNGNDYYSAEVFSQGGSYWFGLGAMIDDNGFDQYIAHVYSQGAGVHLSTGIVLDRAGNDNYSCDHQSQGFAHDFSVGWLIDEAGNDNYNGKNNCQGCAVTNSVAGLIDRAGNDGYMCREQENKGGGYGATTRGYGNIGIQIDMTGSDTYTLPYAGDGEWWNLQAWYFGIDVPDDWWEVETDEEGNELSRKLVISEGE